MKETKYILLHYNELIKAIEDANHAYYNLDSPIMDDAQYDELMQKLLQIENEHPNIKKTDSPSQKVGGNAQKTFSEVRHEPPMMSLGNVFSLPEAEDFARKIKQACNDFDNVFSAELKFDGIAIEAVYSKGEFVQGSTRGNGIVGENITANLSTVKNMPLKLKGENIPDYISIRGEVFMRHEDFDKLNAQRENNGEALFANPRNAAAGSLRQLDAAVTASRELTACFYGHGKIEGKKIESQKELIEYMKELGLPVPENIIFGTIDEAAKFQDHWSQNRHLLEFDIDGIVLKVNSFSCRERAGETTKVPKWAAAWKFAAMEAVTKLE